MVAQVNKKNTTYNYSGENVAMISLRVSAIEGVRDKSLELDYIHVTVMKKPMHLQRTGKVTDCWKRAHIEPLFLKKAKRRTPFCFF